MDLNYLNLSHGPRLDDWLSRAALQAGIEIEASDIDPRAANFSGSMLDKAIEQHRLNLIVANAEEIISGALTQRFGVTRVLFPPVLAIGPQVRDPGHRAVLRHFGVSALMSPDATPQTTGPLLERIAHSGDWLAASLAQVPIAQMLQNIDTDRDVMVALTCPHAHQVATTTEGNLDHARNCQGIDDLGCDGFHARIYIRQGRIVHAECPGRNGTQALAAAINVQHGRYRFCEIYLPAEDETIGASIQTSIMDAAVAWDESVSQPLPISVPRSAAGKPPPPPPRSSQSPAPPAPLPKRVPPVPTVAHRPRATAPTSTPSSSPTTPSQSDNRPTMSAGNQVQRLQDLVQSTPELEGAAICDTNGWVSSVAGQIDAETVCAAVTMAIPALERAAELLGMGAPAMWSVGGRDGMLHACRAQGQMVTGTGRSVPNPDSVLKQLATPVHDGPTGNRIAS